MNKADLDKILEEHRAQPVGSGYIDIIVKKKNYQNFVRELIICGFEIKSISWWEWCQKENKAKYGMGGPKSIYYYGWFAELAIQVDDIEFVNEESEVLIQKILSLIEFKSIDSSDEKIRFQESDWLTPALWLNVPNDWKNVNNK